MPTLYLESRAKVELKSSIPIGAITETAPQQQLYTRSQGLKKKQSF
jgi:hypothetical protein